MFRLLPTIITRDILVKHKLNKGQNEFEVPFYNVCLKFACVRIVIYLDSSYAFITGQLFNNLHLVCFTFRLDPATFKHD